jgi:hypothetical protein
VVTLGYEPQWLLVKKSSGVAYWHLLDSMRGFTATGSNDAFLYPNTNEVEDATLSWFAPSATGFDLTTSHPNVNENGSTYIYIAIRRGPMKVPTSGTSVFAPVAFTGTGALYSNTSPNFHPDLLVGNRRASWGAAWFDKLRGATKLLFSSVTDAEVTSSSTQDLKSFDQLGFTLNAANYNTSLNGGPDILWNFRRAPSFFDAIFWLGTGTTSRVLSHNLGVVPEMIIFKDRDNASGEWYVQGSGIGGLSLRLFLSQDAAQTDGGGTVFSAATSTTLTTSTTNTFTNPSGRNCVAYLFATCAGVSKVGSYTGNGSSQTINCGFTGGARFVLIKKSSGTGDWMVSDSARGIVSGNDPYLELNNTNAEVTGEDWLDTDSTGFVVNEVSGSNANTSSATYIFLAIA